MGQAAEVIAGRATNPGAALTGLTMNTGDSLTVRNYSDPAVGYLEEMWAQGATAGILRVRSPRMHDNVQGLRARYLAATPQPLTALEYSERVFAQDTLIAEISGGAAEVDAAAFFMGYTDIPGVAARLAHPEEIAPRIVHLLSVETNNTTGATAGDWGGSLAINANFDLLKANTDYAILGYNVDVAVNAVGYRGPDTGNLRIGGPGTTQRLETRNWFLEISKRTGRGYVPIINSANKGATTVDLAATQTATAVNVTTFLAELSK